MSVFEHRTYHSKTTDGLSYTIDDSDNPEDGNLMIIFDPEVIKPEVATLGGMTRVTLEIPFEDIRNLYLQYLKDRALRKLNTMDLDTFENWMVADLG